MTVDHLVFYLAVLAIGGPIILFAIGSLLRR